MDVASKIDRLFTVILADTGEEMSYNEVAMGTSALGTPVSPGRLEQLHHGVVTDATVDELRAIAHAFGVPVAYFTDPAREQAIDGELVMLDQIRTVLWQAGSPVRSREQPH